MLMSLAHEPHPLSPMTSTSSPTHHTNFGHDEASIMNAVERDEPDLPPTPPKEEVLESKGLTFVDAAVPQRSRRGRRPLSAYPTREQPPYIPHRKYTDPTPHSNRYEPEDNEQLDVDLDAYSNEFDSREPTLSFLTTSSAAESTTGTPSIGGTYSFKQEDGEKPEMEPRIRMRTTTGRANAYSSAESSGAYSYHAYDNHLFHPHPPPMPVIPHQFTERVGLGFSEQNSERDVAVPSPDPSIPTSYSHRPWRRDVVNRLRSDSASSAFTTASTSTEDTAPSGSVSADNYSAYQYSDRLPWDVEQVEAEPEAVTMVNEGREKILDKAKLEEMGGLGAMSEEVISSLNGITHLLLPNCGSGLIPLLPSLLATLAPSLVVLDISSNDITFLPEGLQYCHSLEELNISSNPLRTLPSFLGQLINLRMLAADDCGLQSLPAEMAHLGSLHTLCARRNRLVSLPPWLCLFGQLDTLRVDGNPFAKEWQAIVAPILSNPPASLRSDPYITPHTPNRPNDINVRSIGSMASLSSSGTASSLHSHDMGPSPSFTSDLMSPIGSASGSMQQISTLGPIAEDHPHSAPIRSEESPSSTGSFKAVKKMRSFGSLLDSGSPAPPVSKESSSSSRFASLGASDGKTAASSIATDPASSSSSYLAPAMTASTSKSGKWGFLRKMSMNRLKSSDKITMTTTATANVKIMPPLHHANSDPVQTLPSPARPGFRTATSSATLPARHLMSPASEFGQALAGPSTLPSSSSLFARATGPGRGKRRSFLPIDTPPSISISIPPSSPFMPVYASFDATVGGQETAAQPTLPDQPTVESPQEVDSESRYATGLESIKSYLRDLFDLSRPPVEPYGGFEVVNGNEANFSHPDSPVSANRNSISEARRRPLDSRRPSLASAVDSVSLAESSESHGKKFKDDSAKRTKVLREIYETERTYVRGLGELVTIYVRPAAQAISPGKPETLVPAAERKVVFGGIESILTIHRDNLLPALERVVKPLLESGDSEDGSTSALTAHRVGEVFRTYIAYMKQYSTYINNFDNALSRMKTWTTSATTPSTPTFAGRPTAPSSAIATAALTAGMSAVSLPTGNDSVPHSGVQMTTSQRKRVKTFLKRCREHPMHSQINLESYLLLPIQRVPRYKLLLEDLAMCTPPRLDGPRDTLDDALNEISGLASLMNEEKRESDSRLRLFQWQQRITSRGPSPLVQPHRRLILDGSLTLIRLVKKASTFVEVDNTYIGGGDGEDTIMPSKVVVPVEYIAPEPMDKNMVLILCSDLMVLAQPRSNSSPASASILAASAEKEKEGQVDLFNVLRMATVREPASIINGNVLRVVDNKSIYYFSGASHSAVLQWCRAINSARRR